MNYIKRKLKHLNNITEFDINGEVIVNGVAANLNNLTITNASALAAG